MTQTPETGTIWVTQEAYDRLQQELDHLRGEVRSDITAKIAAAREEGDLKENGGYHAAREEQGKIEARIRQLEHLLRHATVGEASTDLSSASPGTVITVTVAGRQMRFLLGSREIAGEDTDIDVFSEASPLGAAVNGTKIGESTAYEAPNGKSITVTVDKVEPY